MMKCKESARLAGQIGNSTMVKSLNQLLSVVLVKNSEEICIARKMYTLFIETSQENIKQSRPVLNILIQLFGICRSMKGLMTNICIPNFFYLGLLALDL